MGGLVTGPTIGEANEHNKWLAIMINTGCNLNCPICYLGEKKDNKNMSPTVSARLIHLSKDMAGVVIIGTEPLLDEQSIEIVNFFAREIRTHILTNGINLERFANQITEVKRIDVSLDGGPETHCRSDSFNAIQRGALKWKRMNPKGEIGVLNTLHEENISNVGDMLKGGQLLDVEGVYFSPYVQTLGGQDGTTPLATRKIVESLLPFVDSGQKWKFMIDPYHAIFEWKKWDAIKEEVLRLPEKNRLIIDFDPAEGVRRFEVTGQEKHPFMALHPGIDLSGKKI